MANESDPTPPHRSGIGLLVYSTRLVVGVWLIFTGVELIFKTANGDNDNSTPNCLFGVLRIMTGFYALKIARLTANRIGEAKNVPLDLVTVLLIIMVVGLPLIVFVLQSSAILLGSGEPDEQYQKNAFRLTIVALLYLVATIFANWKPKK